MFRESQYKEAAQVAMMRGRREKNLKKNLSALNKPRASFH